MTDDIIRFDMSETGGNMLRWLRRHYSAHNPNTIVRPMRGQMQVFNDAPLAHWLRLTTVESDTRQIAFAPYQPNPLYSKDKVQHAAT